MGRRRHAPVEIGQRAAAELLQRNPCLEAAARMIGATGREICTWETGISPSAFYLAEMCKIGLDMTYILTGRRCEHERHD